MGAAPWRENGTKVIEGVGSQRDAWLSCRWGTAHAQGHRHTRETGGGVNCAAERKWREGRWDRIVCRDQKRGRSGQGGTSCWSRCGEAGGGCADAQPWRHLRTRMREQARGKPSYPNSSFATRNSPKLKAATFGLLAKGRRAGQGAGMARQLLGAVVLALLVGGCDAGRRRQDDGQPTTELAFAVHGMINNFAPAQLPGGVLHGWFSPGDSPPCTVDCPGGTVMAAPGNGILVGDVTQDDPVSAIRATQDDNTRSEAILHGISGDLQDIVSSVSHADRLKHDVETKMDKIKSNNALLSARLDSIMEQPGETGEGGPRGPRVSSSPTFCFCYPISSPPNANMSGQRRRLCAGPCSSESGLHRSRSHACQRGTHAPHIRSL